jgi:hypothetical protein
MGHGAFAGNEAEGVFGFVASQVFRRSGRVLGHPSLCALGSYLRSLSRIRIEFHEFRFSAEGRDCCYWAQ